MEYYRATKVFATEKDLESVYDSLHKTVDHVEAQVEQGYKFQIGAKTPMQGQGASYKFYVNEFLIGDNTYLVQLNDSRMVVLNHSGLNHDPDKGQPFYGVHRGTFSEYNPPVDADQRGGRAGAEPIFQWFAGENRSQPELIVQNTGSGKQLLFFKHWQLFLPIDASH